jgi:hypothetical protein
LIRRALRGHGTHGTPAAKTRYEAKQDHSNACERPPNVAKGGQAGYRHETNGKQKNENRYREDYRQ